MEAAPDNLITVVINSIILLFLSAVFSGAETAFTNLSPARVQIIKSDGKFASKLIYKLYKKLDLLISLSLILSNGVNIFLATYLTIFFTSLFGIEIGGLLAATIGTVLVILFGEIMPKKIAILFPVAFSRGTAHLLEFCKVVFFPILIPVLLINRAMDRLKKSDKEENRQLMQEEIKATLGIGHFHGALENKEYSMMKKLLLLNDIEVSQIMTHRSEIVAIKADKTLKSLVKLAASHNVTRIPVYKDSIDDIEYIIHTPQLTSYLINSANLDRPVLDFCITEAFKVPESKILDDLFFEFQEKRLHMAIVLDEFGKTNGVITLEDIVEQIFGDIHDETDKKVDTIKSIGEDTFKADGEVNLKDVEEALDVTLPRLYPKHKSLSWLILDILHRFPEEGEIISIPDTGITLEVIDMDEELINKVQIKKT